MFFIGFPTLSYPMRPCTTLIGYTEQNVNPSQSDLLSNYTQINTLTAKHATYQKSEPLRATFLSNLDNMVNKNSSIHSVLSSLQNGRYSFILKTILVHTTIPAILTKSSVNFYVPIQSLLVHKIILAIPG